MKRFLIERVLVPAIVALLVSVLLSGCGPILWKVIPHATPLF